MSVGNRADRQTQHRELVLSAALRPLDASGHCAECWETSACPMLCSARCRYTRVVFFEDMLPGKTCRVAKYLGLLHHATGQEIPKVEQVHELGFMDIHGTVSRTGE